MKMTLLEIVQDILNAMDGDEVNTITETVESEQVSQIVKTTYYELISRRNWPHLKELFELDPSGDSSRPTHMSIPSRIVELRELSYNKVKSGETRKKYLEVTYMEPEKFLVMSNARNSDNTNIEVVEDSTGVEVLIRNDHAPSYWTSFDDQNLVFDSYDSAVDTTLMASKTQCWGIRHPTWTVDDTFIPDLPEDAFALLLAEAKSICQFQMRQFQDAASAQQANRQRFRMSQKSWTANKQNRYPNYGRKR